MTLKSPYPWFGGKSKIASQVWKRLGNVHGYLEPFFGSGAVLLARPHKTRGLEIINDSDGNVVNFWRAVKANAKAVCEYADGPITSLDKDARHRWLCRKEEVRAFVERLAHNPDFYDVKRAGWWVWGVACTIGNSRLWCNRGVYHSPGDEDVLDMSAPSIRECGVHVRSGATTARQKAEHLRAWLVELQNRFRFVQVRCGDWKQCVIESLARSTKGYVGVFLDPPYAASVNKQQKGLYTSGQCVRDSVEEWCREFGGRKEYRIAVCGYSGEYDRLASLGWGPLRWVGSSGYSTHTKKNSNRYRETVWFSPNCLKEGK